MLSSIKPAVLSLSLAALLGACGSRSDQWTLRGTIEGGEGKNLVIETQNFMGWTPI